MPSDDFLETIPWLFLELIKTCEDAGFNLQDMNVFGDLKNGEHFKYLG